MTSLSDGTAETSWRDAWRQLRASTRIVFIVATLYSAALVIAAGTLGSYDTVNGNGVRTSLTLVQENGAKVLLVVAVPLLGTLIVAVSSLIRRRAGRPGVSVITWTVVGVLTLYCIAGVLTVGLFALPVPLLLIGALGATSERDLRP